MLVLPKLLRRGYYEATMQPLAERKQLGFTIVELLIVIVVIAILAAISTLAYSGTQQRARDTKRVDDIAKIVKAFQLWGAETGGNFDTMSAGSGGAEAGWFDGLYTTYPSVASVLIDAGYLTDGVVDPIDRTYPAADAYSYMIASCSSLDSNRYRVVFARLESPPSESPEEQIGATCTGGSFDNYTTTYFMNYAKLVKLN